MKKLLVLPLLFITFFALNSYSDEMQNLKERLDALEQKMESKLDGCIMRYKNYGVYSNNCPVGTVVKNAYFINPNVMQLRCVYYQLQCYKLLPNGERVLEDVKLKVEE